MEAQLIAISSGFLYFLLGLILFFVNLAIFEAWTHFNVRQTILESQNKALGHIIRGQLLAQGILISLVIFFTGHTPDGANLGDLTILLKSFGTTILFAFLGMIFLQWSLKIMMTFFGVEKEILIDQNESLGMIIEAFLVAISLIIAIALYSY